MMPRKKKDALQPERVKTSALVKEPTKAKGKTKAKAAAEEEPHYDIPHGVTIQDICNTYRINMESIAAATNYPIAYIKTLADDPTSSMVPGFQSKLRSAFPIAFDDVDYDDPFGDMLLGGRKSAEEIFYDMTGRTLLQRSLLYQVEYQLPYISASTIVTISTMLEKISTRKTYEAAENFVFSFLSQMGTEDRRFSIWDKGPAAMRVQAGVSLYALKNAKQNGRNFNAETKQRLAKYLFGENKTLANAFYYLNDISDVRIYKVPYSALQAEQKSFRALVYKKLPYLSDEAAEELLQIIWDDIMVSPPKGNNMPSRASAFIRCHPKQKTPLMTSIDWFARHEISNSPVPISSLAPYFSAHKSTVLRILKGAFEFQYKYFETLSETLSLSPEEKEMLRYVGTISMCWSRFDMRDKTTEQREMLRQFAGTMLWFTKEEEKTISDIIESAKARSFGE